MCAHARVIPCVTIQKNSILTDTRLTMVPMVSKQDWAMLTSWPARVGGHTSSEMRRSSNTGMKRTSGSAWQFWRSAILQESRGREAKVKGADIILCAALVFICHLCPTFTLCFKLVDVQWFCWGSKTFLHPFCILFLSLYWCSLVLQLLLISQCVYVCVLIWKDGVRNGEVVLSVKKIQLCDFTFHRGNLRIIFVLLHQRNGWKDEHAVVKVIISFCITVKNEGIEANSEMLYLRAFQLPFHVGLPNACWNVPFLHHLAQVEEAVNVLVLEVTLKIKEISVCGEESRSVCINDKVCFCHSIYNALMIGWIAGMKATYTCRVRKVIYSLCVLLLLLGSRVHECIDE